MIKWGSRDIINKQNQTVHKTAIGRQKDKRKKNRTHAVAVGLGDFFYKSYEGKIKETP